MGVALRKAKRQKKKKKNNNKKKRKVHKHKINGYHPTKKRKEQMRKTFLEKDICTHMFTDTLFTIAKRWNNLNVQ